MNTNITQEALQQFIKDAGIQIDHYVQAQAHLSQIPALVREVFSLRLNADTKEVLDQGLEKVIHRVNSNFFINKVDNNQITLHCMAQYHDALSEQLDLAKAERIVALVNNEVPLKDIILGSLEKSKETEVKTTMRLLANSNLCTAKDIAPDFVYPILKQKGETERFADIKLKVRHLIKGDEVSFADLGFTFSLAQNGNLTIKIEKEVVNQLNELLK